MSTVTVYCDFSSADNEILSLLEKSVSIHLPEDGKRLKDESVFARALLKYMLSEYFGITDFHIGTEENGKPYLIGSDICFNFSHCFKRIICTVSDDDVGCDVQDIRAFNPRIVSRFFTSDEGLILSASNNKDEHFTKLWVLKESILKYKGVGIAGGIESYSFPEFLMCDSFCAYGVKFRTFKKDGFVYGVCYQSDDITVKEVCINDIAKN